MESVSGGVIFALGTVATASGNPGKTVDPVFGDQLLFEGLVMFQHPPTTKGNISVIVASSHES